MHGQTHIKFMSIILTNAVHMSQKTHHELTMKTDQLILLT